jgi:hypothetical protein
MAGVDAPTSASMIELDGDGPAALDDDARHGRVFER